MQYITFLTGVLLGVVLMLLDNAFLLVAVSAIFEDKRALHAPLETVSR